VFGEGGRAHLLLVGEQPGDAEDRQGRPFVGPAAGCSTMPWPPPAFPATTCT
jgi:DNA polymerase